MESNKQVLEADGWTAQRRYSDTAHPWAQPGRRGGWVTDWHKTINGYKVVLGTVSGRKTVTVSVVINGQSVRICAEGSASAAIYTATQCAEREVK